MDNNNYKRQWKDLINNQIQRIQRPSNDDSDIQIEVAPKSQKHQQPDSNALTFWLNRRKSRNQQNVINLEDNKKQIGRALNTPKNSAISQKPIQPIGPHSKQKGKSNTVSIINLQNQSKKKNLQTYKTAIFSNKDQKKPIVVESQQESRRRMQRQLQIINEMNKPRWVLQKEKRSQTNKMKYPISNTTSYSYPAEHTNSHLDKYNQFTWREYQRNQEEIRSKNRQKLQQERKKDKQKRAQEMKKRKKQEIQQYQSLFDGILGLQTKKKQKLEQPQQTLNQEENVQNENIKQHEKEKMEKQVTKQIRLQKGQILDGINESQSSQNENIEDQPQKKSKLYVKKKQNRYGLSDIVKPYQSIAPNFINVILYHNFSLTALRQQNKRIPDVFQDQSVYKKVFHYLIVNECIADLTQKISNIEKGRRDEPIKIIINSKFRTNNDGQTEIMIKQSCLQDNKVIKLKSMSLSKYRLGLVTSRKEFKREFYGIPSRDPQNYAFIVMLMTPQSKEELGQEVRCVSGIRINEIEWMMINKKSNQAYYYDLQKISTFVREYLAVSNFIYSELAPAVLNPLILQNEMREYVENKECLNDILLNLKNIFNETQWESIRQMVLIERGIVMLQGPPGTGKTSTLMGLLSAQYEYLRKIGDNRKIMICAPSNAAVDHIVKRIKNQGLVNGEGCIIKPNILRVGIVDSQDPDILDVYLDGLCEKKMIEQSQNAKKFNSQTTPQIKQRLILLQKELRLMKPPNPLIAQKKQEIIVLQNHLYSFRQEKCVLSKRKYNEFQSIFLNQAEIILTTLSSSGSEKMERIRGEIACLIIDQAAQATQPNLLIAFQTGVSKVLLIGDPYQLPATCISTDSNVTLYNRSLFERFLDASIKPYFLNIQYRMVPMIRHFPSLKFYNNRLIDSSSVLKRRLPEYIKLFANRNVIFVDVKYSRQHKKGDSYCNQYEAQIVGLLVYCLFDQNITLGVITPYQAQKRSIIKAIKSECQTSSDSAIVEAKIDKNVMINTVDSFQGQQKDIIIVSTARSNDNRSIGFLTDERRINVTLTRAKSLLIVVGNGNTLGCNEVWNDFLLWTQQQKVYYEIHQKQGFKKVIANAFEEFNKHSIKRTIYKNLSSDPRKIHRHEIESKDFSKKKEKNKNPQKSSNLQSERTSMKEEKKEVEKEGNRKEDIQMDERHDREMPNKFAMDIKDSELILQGKRRKQKQAQQFEELNLRMKKLQEEMSRQGFHNPYKQLFQGKF